MQKRRIAHIVSRPQLRGAQIFARHLQDALAAEYETRLFYSGRTGPIGLPSSLLRLRAELRRFEPELLVAHGGEPLRAVVLARAQRGCPLVYRRISSVPEAFRTPGRMASLKRSYSKVHTFVPVSSSLEKELVEDFGIDPERITVIGPGRPVAAPLSESERTAMRRELGFQAGDLVAWVGGMVEEKDPLAAIAVARRLPHINFVMVGDGRMIGRVRAAAPENVTVTGPREDARRIIASSDILISTSRTEGAPGVLVEGLMAGVPAVATDVGGVSEVISDRSGILVAHGHGDAIAREVSRLMSEPERRRRMAEAALEEGARFDMEKIAASYDELFKSILAQGPPKA